MQLHQIEVECEEHSLSSTIKATYSKKLENIYEVCYNTSLFVSLNLTNALLYKVCLRLWLDFNQEQSRFTTILFHFPALMVIDSLAYHVYYHHSVISINHHVNFTVFLLRFLMWENFALYQHLSLYSHYG